MARQSRLTREESQAQTRERLLEAARRTFARGGYGGASVDTISAEAGFSKGAFYSNFPTKEAIFLELLERHMVSEVAQIQQLVESTSDAKETMSKLDVWLDQMNEDADWALLAMELQLHARRSPSFAKQFDELQNRQREKLGILIERLFSSAGKLMPLPAVEVAGAMIALAHGLVLQHPREAGRADPSGPIIGIFLRSLLVAAAEE